MTRSKKRNRKPARLESKPNQLNSNNNNGNPKEPGKIKKHFSKVITVLITIASIIPLYEFVLRQFIVPKEELQFEDLLKEVRKQSTTHDLAFKKDSVSLFFTVDSIINSIPFGTSKEILLSFDNSQKDHFLNNPKKTSFLRKLKFIFIEK